MTESVGRLAVKEPCPNVLTEPDPKVCRPPKVCVCCHNPMTDDGRRLERPQGSD